MDTSITTYRICVPCELDSSGTYPQLVVSAASLEDARREAWILMTWPETVENASALEVTELAQVRSLHGASRP